MPPPNTPENASELADQRRRAFAIADFGGPEQLRLAVLAQNAELAEGEPVVDSHPQIDTEDDQIMFDVHAETGPVDDPTSHQHISHSASSSFDLTPPSPRHQADDDELIADSLPPAIAADLQPSDYEADHEADYEANYAGNPQDSALSQNPHTSSEQINTLPAPADASLANSTRALSFTGEQQAVPLPESGPLPAAMPGTAFDATSLQRLILPGPESQPRGVKLKTPKIDWHSLEYVDTYDENLDCPICRGPLVQPQITTCFHIFCYKCLAQSLLVEDRCPIDRLPMRFFESTSGRIASRPAPHVISNQLDNLQVRCPNTRCNHVAARSSIEHHYNVDCSYTKIPCPDPSCMKLITRRFSTDGTCMHKIMRCTLCHKLVDMVDFDDHFAVYCSKRELQCTECLESVPRYSYEKHVRRCPERLIECRYSSSGCIYVAKQKYFGDHEEKCLPGIVMRMERAQRAEKNNLDLFMQDTHDRVCKLEGLLATWPPQLKNPPPPPPPPPMYELHTNAQPCTNPNQDAVLREYYDELAAGGVLARGENSDDTQPERPAAVNGSIAHHRAGVSDDPVYRMTTYVNSIDTKVEHLERYLGEVDVRQSQMFISELGPVKDQMLEMRSTINHMGMYVRWLVETMRQAHKETLEIGLPGEEGVAGGRTAAAAPITSTAASAAGTPVAAAPNSSRLGSSATVPRLRTSARISARRMGDRENPPRL
ncbi:hypothetical protein SEPCBS119000_000912 [Sporothrix epigloea]|uniref:Traf-like signal protein n=1 Tax=Sporothrix epigloea TaxID=1892477 RepID=A0ABP0D7W4_9PEZI